MLLLVCVVLKLREVPIGARAIEILTLFIGHETMGRQL
jgi:hypothetical protein